MANKVVQILLIIGSIGTFIFLSACCGGNVWIKQSLGVIERTEGLWKGCVKGMFGSSNEICDTLKGDLPDWYKASRAFSILSVLAAVASILFAILALAVEKMKGLFSSLFLFCAAGAMIIALAVYTAKMEDLGVMDTYEYGWSYIIGWLGIVGAGVSAVIGFFA